MDVAVFDKHTVTECNCCGLVMVVDNGPRGDLSGYSYPVSGPISEAYQAHLDAEPACRKWHDELPTFESLRGILRDKE